MSEKMIEMSGCSKIEIEIARMFWKSFTLQPPIESKLYSPDIKQRRKTADAAGRRKNEYEPMQVPSYVYEYQKYSDEEEKRRGMIASFIRV
jgi:DNA repair photolyase